MKNPIEVVFFQRKPTKNQKSVEIVFDDVRKRNPGGFNTIKHVFSFPSTGLINRLKIISEAIRFKSQVNHVTGDVQFVTSFLPAHNTVLTVLDCGILEVKKGWQKWILKCFWYQLPCLKASVITVISESTKQELLKYVPSVAAKIVVVPVAVSEAFCPGHEQTKRLTTKILVVGTKENKNLSRIINAVKGLECSLMIIGQLTTEQLNLIKETRIAHENFVNISEEKMIELYQGADMLCFPSTYEGFGMPILEAQKVGIPVITSNILSMPEVAGNGAILVDPFSINEIRKAILFIVNNPAEREKLITLGFENVKRFNPNIIANQYYEIYQKLAHQKRKS